MYPTLGFQFAAALILAIAASAGSAVEPTPAPVAADVHADRADGPPPAGQALISFLRPPSPSEGLVKYAESVWEIVEDKAIFVGVLKSRQRINLTISRGSHLFMVVGETAEFMSAEVDADRTYYATLTGEMGAWRPRFWLRPVHQSEFGSREFADALSVCTLIEKQARDDAWAATNIRTVEARRAKSYADWQRKAEGERPALLPADGR